MSATRLEAVLVGRVSNHDRRAVRSRVTVLTSDYLDLIRPDVLRPPCFRYGDTILRVVAAMKVNYFA